MDSQTTQVVINKFLFIFGELTLLFLGVSFFVQFIQQKLSAETIQRLLGGRKGAKGYIIAALLGSVTPFCSCSTIPLLKGLIRSRAGFGATMTFLFTSPLLNPIIIAMFIPMLGIRATVIYFLFALVFSLVASILLEKWNFERFLILDDETTVKAESNCGSTSSCGTTNKTEETSSCGSSSEGSSCSSSINVAKSDTPFIIAAKSAWKDYSKLLPHLLVSAVIGSFIYGVVPAEFLQKYIGNDNLWSIPIAAIIGIPMYINTAALLPISSALISKGVSLGAVMALIIGGGGASIPELILLKTLFKKQLMIAFVTVILLMAVSAGFTMLAFVG